MSSLNGRKVATARLHGTSYVQGIGSIGPSVTADSAKIKGGLDLTYYDGGVLCRTTAGLEFYLSGGNIQLMEFAPVEASSPST